MDTEYMTGPQVANETIKILSNISLPAALSTTIGIPICSAITNLKAMREIMELDAKRLAELQPEKQAEESPEQPEKQPEESPEEGEPNE